MTTAAQAVERLEAAGAGASDRAATWATLLTDEQLHQHLAELPGTDREAAYAAIGAALRRAAPIRPLRDAVVAAMRARMESGQGRAGKILGLPMPSGYLLDPDSGGLYQLVLSKEGKPSQLLVSRRHIALTGVVHDPAGGQVHVTVSWRSQTGEVESATVPRSVVTDARAIVGTLSTAGTDGAPVHAGNARAVVEFLAAQEDRAGDTLPRSVLARQLGYVYSATREPMPLGFLAGRTLITSTGEQSTTSPAAPVLLDPSLGLASIADRVHRGGTLAGWRDAMLPALDYPVIGLILCASLAPLLLAPLHLATSAGILDVSGPQGTGKTRAVEIAGASVWGPGCLSSGPMVDVQGSEAGLRDHRLAVGGLPLLLNETQHLRRFPELLASLPFQIYEGQSKILSAGAGQGTRPLAASRSGAILTGNTSLIDLADDVEGLRTRVLTSTLPPWGQASPETRNLIHATYGAVREHYGHAGPEIARALLSHPEWWPDLRRTWAQRATFWAARLGAKAERASDVLAIYEMAGGLAIRYLGLSSLDLPAVMEVACGCASASLADVDPGIRSLRAATSWAASRSAQLDGRVSSPTGGPWIGRWDTTPGAPLMLAQGPLCDMLRAHKHNVEDSLKAWAASGWIERDRDRRTWRRVIGGVSQPVYILTPAGMEAARISSGAKPQSQPLTDGPPPMEAPPW